MGKRTFVRRRNIGPPPDWRAFRTALARAWRPIANLTSKSPGTASSPSFVVSRCPHSSTGSFRQSLDLGCLKIKFSLQTRRRIVKFMARSYFALTPLRVYRLAISISSTLFFFWPVMGLISPKAAFRQMPSVRVSASLRRACRRVPTLSSRAPSPLIDSQSDREQIAPPGGRGKLPQHISH